MKPCQRNKGGEKFVCSHASVVKWSRLVEIVHVKCRESTDCLSALSAVHVVTQRKAQIIQSQRQECKPTIDSLYTPEVIQQGTRMPEIKHTSIP